MEGTESQIEWAERIKQNVSIEFASVAASFTTIALRQPPEARSETEAVIAILEEKRNEVMKNDRAGYFITEWQEINDQVRQLIFQDARYQAIKDQRAARQSGNSKEKQ